MLKITNISHNPQRFTTTTGRRVEIAPGATENVAVAADNVRVLAKVNAGLIRITEHRSTYRKPQQRASPAKTDEPTNSEE